MDASQQPGVSPHAADAELNLNLLHENYYSI